MMYKCFVLFFVFLVFGHFSPTWFLLFQFSPVWFVVKHFFCPTFYFVFFLSLVQCVLFVCFVFFVLFLLIKRVGVVLFCFSCSLWIVPFSLVFQCLRPANLSPHPKTPPSSHYPPPFPIIWGLPVLQWETVYIIQSVPSTDHQQRPCPPSPLIPCPHQIVFTFLLTNMMKLFLFKCLSPCLTLMILFLFCSFFYLHLFCFSINKNAIIKKNVWGFLMSYHVFLMATKVRTQGMIHYHSYFLLFCFLAFFVLNRNVNHWLLD